LRTGAEEECEAEKRDAEIFHVFCRFLAF